jgi:hypothetical protein
VVDPHGSRRDAREDNNTVTRRVTRESMALPDYVAQSNFYQILGRNHYYPTVVLNQDPHGAARDAPYRITVDGAVVSEGAISGKTYDAFEIRVADSCVIEVHIDPDSTVQEFEEADNVVRKVFYPDSVPLEKLDVWPEYSVGYSGGRSYRLSTSSPSANCGDFCKVTVDGETYSLNVPSGYTRHFEEQVPYSEHYNADPEDVFQETNEDNNEARVIILPPGYLVSRLAVGHPRNHHRTLREIQYRSEVFDVRGRRIAPGANTSRAARIVVKRLTGSRAGALALYLSVR